PWCASGRSRQRGTIPLSDGPRGRLHPARGRGRADRNGRPYYSEFPAHRARRARAGGRRRTAMARILLVDDNEMTRDMLSRGLQRKGHAVLLALDGAEGVAAARTQKPDLILMDMSLPVLDGWEATRQLKADAATRAIPVIALTAHAMAGDEEKARE